MNEDRDPLLDACLEEVLGGQKPPDLTARILQAFNHSGDPNTLRPTGVEGDNPGSPPPQCIDVVVRNEVPGKSASVVELPQQTSSRKVRDWRLIAGIALTVAGVLVAVVVTVGNLQRRGENQTVTTVPAPKDARSDKARQEPAPIIAEKTPVRKDAETNTDGRRGTTESNAPPPAQDSIANSKSLPMPRTSVTPGAQDATKRKSPDRQRTAPALPDPLADEILVAHINTALRAKWAQSKVTPANSISATQWCERAYRLVLGRDPTAAEWKSFQSEGKADRKQKLLAKLLSDEHIEEFARRWSEYFTDVFLDPDSLGEGTLANRDGMLQYFRRAILDRQPFDEVAAGLLTATGSGVPGQAGYNGAANFLLARANKDFTLATADVSRLFLGRSIDCQQCHDGPQFDSGKQMQFWELNAFFRQVHVQRDEANASNLLADRDIPVELGHVENAEVVFFEAPNGLFRTAYPVFFDGTNIPGSHKVAEVNRRQELAWLVSHSPDFRRAMTNRLWSALLGRGFMPFEQVVRNNSLTCPEPLAEMSDQFAAHRFDIRRIITWAALSEPFELVGDASPSVIAVADGEAPLFDRFYDAAPRPRQNTYESLLATAKEFGNPNPANPAAAKLDPLRKPFEKNGRDIVPSPSNAEALLLSGGGPENPMLKPLFSNSKLTSQQKAEHLFQLALHRQPRARELAIVNQMLEKAGDNPQVALQSLWVALNAQQPTPLK